MKHYLLIVFFFSFFCANAQNLDLQLNEINYYGDSYPTNITKFGNKICFTSYYNYYQRGLWLYDESTEDMYSVGSGGTVSTLKTVDNTLYYTKYSDTYELWKTDGTIEGTTLVKDLNTSSNISQPTTWNGKLYFIRYNQNYGSEIWESDGTEAGTHILKDINPENTDDGIYNLFVFNNSLYFSANSSEYGNELWKSDGTEVGTLLFKDIATGISNSNPSNPIIHNNNFFFFCTTPENGTELWKSDGTTEGTTLFKEFVAGPMGLNVYQQNLEGISVPGQYFIFLTYYDNYRRLWKSDGTIDGTTELKILNQQTDNIYLFSDFKLLNDVPYFLGHEYYGIKGQIWTTNGTPEGTVATIDITQLNGGNISNFSASDSYLIFSIFGNDYDLKPWISDGTQGGTHLLSNISVQSTSAGYLEFFSSANKTYFPAGYNSANGVELWATDGTELNTKMVKDLSHTYSGILTGRGTLSSSKLNNKLIFAGNDGLSGTEPFISDGTQEGTRIIKDINPNGYNSCGFTNELTGNIFTKVNNKIYFNGITPESGWELFVTDGTEEGTHLVKDISPGSTSGVIGYTYLMTYNDIFFFKANDNIHGEELWRTDGTEEGTWMVKDIYPGTDSGLYSSNSYYNSKKNYAVCNGFLYFLAQDVQGRAIWRTDGTEAGTTKVIVLENNAEPQIIGANNNRIFITNYGLNYLYSSDGTQDGTTLIQSGIISNYLHFHYTCIVNNQLYYNVNTYATGRSVFRSDGTLAGTVLIKGDLPTDLSVKFMESCGDNVFFGLGSNGYLDPYSTQVWKTDGTTFGTTQLYVAEDYGTITDYNCLGNKLLFLKTDFMRPSELLISDGIATNLLTVNVTNASQFNSVSSSEGLSSIFGTIGNKLFLGGQTSKSGLELYVTTLDENFLNLPDDETYDDKHKNDIVLYPNPSKEWVNIYSSSSSIIYSLEIFDLTGKQLATTIINNTGYKLATTFLPNGIYLIKVMSSNGIITRKLIKS
nr:ELWxxDGT repeat protein [uncultured Flavobacterium sp.]